MKKLLSSLTVALSLLGGTAYAQFEADQKFLTAHGRTILTNPESYAYEQHIIAELGNEDTMWNLFDSSLSQMAHALAQVHLAEPELERARYRIRLHLNPDDSENFSYLDVVRINMGPIVREELIASYGAENVEEDERDQHPHRHWAVVLETIQGGSKVVGGLSAGELKPNTELLCLGLPCMEENIIPESPKLAKGVWKDWEPKKKDFKRQTLRSPIKHPSIPFILMAANTERAFLGQGNWEISEPLPKDWRTEPVAEMIVELAPGNGDGDFATLCVFNQADGSVKDSCVSLHVMDEFEAFQRYTNCYRGRPNKQGLCP